jgi:type I restriction enzyme, S subunit
MSTAVPVSELADQVRGVTYGKGDASSAPRPGYLPVLRAGNITENGLTFDDLVFVPAERVSEKQRIRQNDVVIAASSGSLDVVGKAARALNDYEGGFGAFCKVLRPGPEVDPAYFAHFFRTPQYRQRVSALAAGANINNLRNEHLDQMQIPLPPLPAQRRLAEILDKADALRAKRRAALGQLDTLSQSIFLDMFGDPATNPKGWSESSLGSVLLDVTNGMTRRRSGSDDGQDIVLRLRDIREGWIDFSDVNRITLTAGEAKKYEVIAGDLLFIRVNGNPEYVGRCALFGGFSEKVYFNDHVMRVRVDPRRVGGMFLTFLLNGGHGKREIARHRKTSAGQHTINQAGLARIQLPVPPLALQVEFGARISAIEAAKKSQASSLSSLDALFASLQSRAFRGEL